MLEGKNEKPQLLFFLSFVFFFFLISVLLLSLAIYFAMASYHLETDELEKNHGPFHNKLVVDMGALFQNQE